MHAGFHLVYRLRYGKSAGHSNSPAAFLITDGRPGWKGRPELSAAAWHYASPGLIWVIVINDKATPAGGRPAKSPLATDPLADQPARL